MRHRLKDNHLGRTASHRSAMLSNMAASLLIHKRIRTTLAKAKALRRYVEPLLTKSKNDTTHSRRTVFSYLQNKYAVKTLFTEIAPEIMERPGGYTRILKLGRRQGDGAEMCLMELVDFNEYLEGKPLAKTATKRRPKKKPAAPAATPKKEELQTVAEEVAQTEMSAVSDITADVQEESTAQATDPEVKSSENDDNKQD